MESCYVWVIKAGIGHGVGGFYQWISTSFVGLFIGMVCGVFSRDGSVQSVAVFLSVVLVCWGW